MIADPHRYLVRTAIRRWAFPTRLPSEECGPLKPDPEDRQSIKIWWFYDMFTVTVYKPGFKPCIYIYKRILWSNHHEPVISYNYWHHLFCSKTQNERIQYKQMEVIRNKATCLKGVCVIWSLQMIGQMAHDMSPKRVQHRSVYHQLIMWILQNQIYPLVN